jgi:DNA-binding MarR family transcriptional regulator
MGGTLRSEPVPSSEEAGVGGLDAIVGFHIRLAHGAVYRHFTESFADLELTQKQVSVLWLLDERPGLTQTDVGQRLQMDRASVMAIVNRLQSRGFLRRGRSAQDGRRQTLHLTPTGHAMLLRARAAVLAHEHWLKSRFSSQEINLLVNLLKRIHD